MATPLLVNGTSGVSSTAIYVTAQDATLLGVAIYNPSNAAAFVQFFDMPASTPPTVGTTVPKWSVGMATVTSVVLAFAPQGLYFTGGLWIAATTTVGGSSAPSAALAVNLALA